MLLYEVELMLSQPSVALSSLVPTAGCHQPDHQLLQFPNVRTPKIVDRLFSCFFHGKCANIQFWSSSSEIPLQSCCCPFQTATAWLIGMHVPGNPQLHLTIPLIHICIIYLRTSLQSFMVRNSKMKEISSVLSLLPLLPSSRAAAD